MDREVSVGIVALAMPARGGECTQFRLARVCPPLVISGYLFKQPNI